MSSVMMMTTFGRPVRARSVGAETLGSSATASALVSIATATSIAATTAPLVPLTR